ncbi:hypothetical protein L1887_28406 [Cichorium endivia]|nr:hypothetical protein L1887_28406 [Cichorium endivia]
MILKSKPKRARGLSTDASLLPTEAKLKKKNKRKRGFREEREEGERGEEKRERDRERLTATSMAVRVSA